MSGTLKRWLREPLVQFLLVGLGVFVLDGWIGRGETESPVVVTRGEVDRLSALWERQWRRPPTTEELQGLVADQVREELLYREALRLGLDEDDTVVRRRLAQKLRFLVEDRALPDTPPEDELRAYFASHPDRYRRPSRLSLRQIPFVSDRDGPAPGQAAREVLARLGSGEALETARLGDPSMLPRRVEDWTTQELGAEFGEAFAAEATALVPGSWQGPVASAFGVHLVYVDARSVARPARFEEVRARVARDWLEDRRRESRAAFHAELLERYPVEIRVDGLTLPAPSP